MSIQRIYVVKKDGYNQEAKDQYLAIKSNLHIKELEDIIILNRYDIEGISKFDLDKTITTVFSEPPVDKVYMDEYPFNKNNYFAVEYLSGQYDQRADSAIQSVKIITGIDDINIKAAKVYILKGKLSLYDTNKIKGYIINPIDQREAILEKPDSLKMPMVDIEPVKSIVGFTNMNKEMLLLLLNNLGLTMSIEDILFSQKYFKDIERRNPTETEIKLLDTYWSDHCRHTTFNTHILDIVVEDGDYKDLINDGIDRYNHMRDEVYGKNSLKEKSLMDLALIGAKYAKKKGLLDNLELSDENNACSIIVDVKTSNGNEEWLLQFKNETHNHPTEIEPFGGAATCLGGAIRDPLSGRAYVYQGMRITGSGDPREDISKTLQGKLPQIKITKEAARGFSSYGNQIGIATGYVQEYYHEGFLAKRMEVGAVIGAVKRSQVIRESPTKDDIIILIGGRTGRDGVGGATGSSKEHDISSINKCSAEVQKGNAPEEHKVQRLFRKEEVSLMIKKCNDFGAGGIGVAIGEIADSLIIDLNSIPLKYLGLNGTEIALSESQERMAVVISPENKERFFQECNKENIEATVVATVTDNKRLVMTYNGSKIVDIKREFLDSSGAVRFQNLKVCSIKGNNYFHIKRSSNSFKETIKKVLSDINIASQKGLVEMFDSTIGSLSVVTPFGGAFGYTPSESMIAKIPVLGKETSTISIMSAGYNPYISSWSPYHGAFYAVIESVAKIIAAGGSLKDIRLSFQEYFEKLGTVDSKWGKPFASLLGALRVEDELGLAAIGGKDSMSGTFKDPITGKELNVPPTLISFAVAPSDLSRVITGEFKGFNNSIYFLKTPFTQDNIIDFNIFRENVYIIEKLIADNVVLSIYTIKSGGILEALSKASFGNMIGLNIYDDVVNLEAIQFPYYGSFIIEVKSDISLNSIKNIVKIAETKEEREFRYGNESIAIEELLRYWIEPLEDIFPSYDKGDNNIIAKRDYNKKTILINSSLIIKPKVAILALPGTNCEYDTSRAFEINGSHEVDPFIFRNRSILQVNESCDEFAKLIMNSQILAIPGGFSGGDEPEGSGKFFVSVFKNNKIKDAIHDLIHKRDGLIIGICNGFQALIKTGLLFKGYISDLNEDDPTLSFNKIGRHVSHMVKCRVSSVNSPWMSLRNIGEIDIVSISHGEGRFIAPQKIIDNMFDNGQIIFQYVNMNGDISMESPFNPNGSDYAVEGLVSPDGRILGKMGHSERVGNGLHMNNRYGNMEQNLFKAGVRYFTGV